MCGSAEKLRGGAGNFHGVGNTPCGEGRGVTDGWAKTGFAGAGGKSGGPLLFFFFFCVEGADERGGQEGRKDSSQEEGGEGLKKVR